MDYTVQIVTVSDRCFRGEREDLSEPVLEPILHGLRMLCGGPADCARLSPEQC